MADYISLLTFCKTVQSCQSQPLETVLGHGTLGYNHVNSHNADQTLTVSGLLLLLLLLLLLIEVWWTDAAALKGSP